MPIPKLELIVLRKNRVVTAASATYNTVAIPPTILPCSLRLITAFVNRQTAMNMNIAGRREITTGAIPEMWLNGSIRRMGHRQARFRLEATGKCDFARNAIILIRDPIRLMVFIRQQRNFSKNPAATPMEV